jgi:hypothetical protein
MRDLQFDWDPKKDAANQRKHGVSFEEASTVSSDEHALLIDDPDHSEEEEHFILLGLSAGLRTLVVCHCYREAQDVIRFISARKASKKEREAYGRGWRP